MQRIKCSEPLGCLEHTFRLCTEWSMLEDIELKVLFRDSTCKTYELGEVIYREGSACDGVFFVMKGLIGIRKADPGGDDTLLWLAGPGDTLAYRALLAGERHRNSAEVLKPVTGIHINRSLMMHLIQANSQFGISFLRRAARELGRIEERLHETITLKARARLAHLLLLFHGEHHSGDIKDGLTLELPVSRADLASLLGIRRESLSRLIRALESDGVARFEGRQVHLLKAQTLIDEYHLHAGSGM